MKPNWTNPIMGAAQALHTSPGTFHIRWYRIFISHPRLPISLLFFPAFPVKAVIIVVVGGGGSLPIGFGANLHTKLHPPGSFWFWVAMVVDAGRKEQDEGRCILKRFNAFPFLRSSAVIICTREIRQLGDVVRWRLSHEFQSVAWIIDRFPCKLHRFFATVGFNLLTSFFFLSLLNVSFQNDTMRVIFMYSKEKPQKGSTELPGPLEAFKGSRSVFLTQRTNQQPLANAADVNILELRNEDVELPESDESLYWCKIFKLDDFHQKHHLVRVSHCCLGIVIETDELFLGAQFR